MNRSAIQTKLYIRKSVARNTAEGDATQKPEVFYPENKPKFHKKGGASYPKKQKKPVFGDWLVEHIKGIAIIPREI
ncbi:hypothetical protein [Paenibacillus graminis]|uniref:hypothetical protein n=1 Tax=Paenibacillus graminis TaxID=189425 RepID=UPI0012DDA0F7|nr:hypothetical protein [Paenibacillus graminis]